MKNKSIILIIFLTILSISNFSLNAQTTVSIRLGPQTGQDAMIADLYPNNNFNYHGETVAIAWTVEGIPSNDRSLFQFNLNSIPSNSRIIDARLSLFGNATCASNPLNFGQNQSFLRKVVSQWNANTVTWNSQPNYVLTNQVLLPQSNVPQQDYLNIDVTDLVRDMIHNPGSSFGFVFMLQTEIFYRCLNFSSSECPDSSKRPLLQITYNPVGINQLSSEVPEKYNIYQNYPNPFNPVTNIKFDIPKSSFTKVIVLDILGRELETLVERNLDAGRYSIDWNADNYTSGKYFYRIQSGDFIETKGMIVLK